MKALITASVASMIIQFNMNNIDILQKLGYKVEVACNFDYGSSVNNIQIEKLKCRLSELNIKFYQIEYSRKVFNIFKIVKAIKQMRKIMQNGYDVIHCHAPICGIVTRFVAKKFRKQGTKVIYTAHGFHFYKGAPIKNWLFYYPIEKICSKWTDVLITINKEDFDFAKRKMKAKETVYIPGVGVDNEKIKSVTIDRNSKREELNIPPDNFVFLSVGELNRNKNHKVVIKALSMLNYKNVTYVIAGQGGLKEDLKSYAEKNGVDVRLLGYRNDIFELMKMSDIFIHPSFREGLPVSVIEALMAGLPVVASDIRGCKDLINADSGILCNPKDARSFCKAFETILNSEKQFDLSKENFDQYSKSNVKDKVEQIYKMKGIE